MCIYIYIYAYFPDIYYIAIGFTQSHFFVNVIFKSLSAPYLELSGFDLLE